MKTRETHGMRRWAAIVFALLGMASCQTAPPPPPDQVSEPVNLAPREFQPATTVSQLQFESGNYPNLFAPSSQAIWINESVTAMRRNAAIAAGDNVSSADEEQAALVVANHVIIECALESMFPDMSIGYDIVGGRGATIYLTTPDGRKAAPVRTLIGQDLREEQRGALRLFGRTNMLVFARRDLWTEAALAAPGDASVRLVIEAHGTTFYFEWPTATPVVPAPVSQGAETLAILKTTYEEYLGRLKRLVHRFD